MFKRIRLLWLFIQLFAVAFAQKNMVSTVWIADQGSGIYKNPILHADYSDPDVIRIGDDYYMTASSFNCMPGLPILHSKDLVNWQLVNHAVKQLEPTTVYDLPQHGKGIWAPAMCYHKGELYIYYADPDYGVFMVKTKDPMGDWDRPVLVLPGKGVIDPCAFWDDDGQAYLAVGWAASRAGVNSLLTIFRLDETGSKVLDEGKHVFDGHDQHHTVEGPKLYKRHGYYYIFAPAGGVATGWQLVLRSRDIYGPYEAKIVMNQGKTAVNGPHQGAYVETPRGEPWFLHFQDKGAYGRVVHLQPVKWMKDWPVIGRDLDGNGIGEPILTHQKPTVAGAWPISTPAESDEFNSDTLGMQWQWHANPKIQWSALLRGKGHLRLFAYPVPVDAQNLWPVPHLLLQKFPAPDFEATTQVKYTVEWDVWKDKKAGLVVTGDDYAYLAIAKDSMGYKLQQVVCSDAVNGYGENVIAEQRLKRNEAFLKVRVQAPAATCQFYYSEDGRQYSPIGKPFMAKPDKWIGAKVGLFCISTLKERVGGYADFDFFHLTVFKN